MATTTRRRGSVKQQELETAGEAGEIVRDQLEELARLGAREMLMAALNDERDAYLGRGPYERSGEARDAGGDMRPFRGYRNGRTPHRVTLGCGTVQLDVPRVRDIPPGQVPFASKIVRRYQRRSDRVDETFMKLFIEGLATRDFEPALRLLVGERAPLSPSDLPLFYEPIVMRVRSSVSSSGSPLSAEGKKPGSRDRAPGGVWGGGPRAASAAAGV